MSELFFKGDVCAHTERGDCLELMRGLPDKSVDLILCDLPYGTTACAWDSVIPFDKLWAQYRRISRGAIVLTANQPFTTAMIASNLKDFRYSWIWEKTNVTGFANAKKRPLKKFEDVCVFSVDSPPYFPQGLLKLEKPRIRTAKVGEHVGDTGFYDGYAQSDTNYPTNILKIANAKNTVHPTQKPVELMEYLIKTYTEGGGLVLDNCMGSGTTGVACMNTGRNFIGFELNENYYAIANYRIFEATRKQAA